MKFKHGIFCLLFVLLLSFAAAGCAAQNDTRSPAVERLVSEETVSFLTEQGDTIAYTVWVDQDQDDTISVTAISNSEFFDTLRYDMAYDEPLSKQDVDIQWTTLTGDPEPKDDDQWAVAVVTISHDGEVISKRKINFVSKAMEIIAGITDPPEVDRVAEGGIVNGWWNLS